MFYYDDIEKKLKRKHTNIFENLPVDPPVQTTISENYKSVPYVYLPEIDNPIPEPQHDSSSSFGLGYVNKEANLSVLDFLNNNLTDDFLIPNNKPFKKKKTGFNFILNYQDKHSKFGLGYKKLKYTSEIFFDDKEKVYNFVNKEVTNENRQYANIKFYMKTMLKDDIYDEAKKNV